MILSLPIILVVSFTNHVYAFCGAPGESPALNITLITYDNNDTDDPLIHYIEGTEISYSCANSDHLLIGSSTRKCIKGHWTQRIPYCASKIDSTLYTSEVEIDVLKVSFTKATEISALRITAVSEDLKSWQRIEPSTFACNVVNASLICISVTGTNAETLSVKFDKAIGNQSTVELFRFVEDTCAPDVPAYANIEIQEKCKVSDNCSHFVYKCWRHFSLEPKNYGSVNCETDGAKIPLCVPRDFCTRLKDSDALNQKYTKRTQWNDTHFIPESIVTFNCKLKDHILRGDATRTCFRNGTWSGDTPVCEFSARNGTMLMPESRTPDVFNVPMLIALCSLVIGSVLIVFILIIVIHKRNQRIAQLQRLGSLRSRNFYFDVPIQGKPSYKHGTRVDDNIGLTSSDYNMDANRDTAIFYTKEMVDNRYSRVTDRFSLPSNGFQYDMSGNLPAVLVTDDPTIPQISL